MTDYAGLLDAAFAAGQVAGVLLLGYGGWLSATAWQFRWGPAVVPVGSDAPAASASTVVRDVPAAAAGSVTALRDEPAHSLSTTA